MSKKEVKNELDKAQEKFEAFDSQVKEMTMDRMNKAPLEEKEPQTQIAQVDREKIKELYIKPSKMIGSKEPFNEKFRKEYDFAKEYVHFEAENYEIIGEKLCFWTKPFPGLPAEYWEIPVNTPVYAPRYVAEQIARCKYHRLIMDEKVTRGGDERGNQYFGAMAVDKTIQRLNARPVSTRKSIFMGVAA